MPKSCSECKNKDNCQHYMNGGFDIAAEYSRAKFADGTDIEPNKSTRINAQKVENEHFLYNYNVLSTVRKTSISQSEKADK